MGNEQRAVELASAAADLAGSLRGMFEADGGAQKNMTCRNLMLALVKWQMVCERQQFVRGNSLEEFATEIGLSDGSGG